MIKTTIPYQKANLTGSDASFHHCLPLPAAQRVAPENPVKALLGNCMQASSSAMLSCNFNARAHYALAGLHII